MLHALGIAIGILLLRWLLPRWIRGIRDEIREMDARDAEQQDAIK